MHNNVICICVNGMILFDHRCAIYATRPKSLYVLASHALLYNIGWCFIYINFLLIFVLFPYLF